MSPARCLLAAALLAIPQRGIAQLPRLAAKSAQRLAPRLVAPFIATTLESEPNDAVAQADPVTLEDTAGGFIEVQGDVDTYAIDLPAGTKVSLSVLAERAGSTLDPTLTLLGTDGVEVLAFSDDFFGKDSHIEHFIPSAGRYFVQVRAFDESGEGRYELSFGTVAAGPGDPVTLYAAGLGAPFGLAAGPAGEVYVADIDARRVLRIAATGQVTPLATLSGEFPVGLVVDGFGDVLVSTVNANFTSGRIERFRGGQLTTFASDLQSGAALTIGPDGDVWVIDPIARVLRRYDPLGGPKGAVSLSSLTHFAFDMGLAFSPAGELYVSDGFDSIYRIVDGAPQLVFQTVPFLNGMAFDKDGFLYVANGALGRVTLLDPDLHVVEDPFARSYLSGATQIAFLRNTDGTVTSRLIADHTGIGPNAPDLDGIVEVNPDGVRATGLRVGVDMLLISPATLPDGLVGADYVGVVEIDLAPAVPTWSLASGTLPPGLTLSPGGQITGIATQPGAFEFTVRGDAGGRFGLKEFTITVTNPTVTVAAAAEHLLGGATLDLPLRRFLDLQGNRNGSFDVGDFRAFLRANGQLPATTVAGKEQP